MENKNSIYDLPEGWVFATIEDIIDYKDGIFKDGDWVESKDQDPKGDVRLIQLADIGEGKFRDRSHRFMNIEKADELRCTFLKKGDILVARMPEPIGRACIFPFEGEFVTVVDVAIIRTGTLGISNKFLMYLINSPSIRREIEQLQTGTTRKRISRRNLGAIKFPIPPLVEQKAIVEKIEELFSGLDEAEKALKKAQRLLEVYRQALLKSAFEGKLTEQWREENNIEPAEKLLERIKEERQKRYEQELADWKKGVKKWKEGKKKEKKPRKPRVLKEIKIAADEKHTISELPNNWALTKIANVSNVGTGVTPLKSNSSFYQDGEIPWVTSGALNDWKVKSPSAYLTKQALQEYNLNLYPKHTLLVALYGEGKTRGKCSELTFESTTNQAVAAIVQKGSEELIRKYLKYYLLKNYTKIRKLATGGAQPNLNLGIIENTVFPLASEQELSLITNELDSQFSFIKKLKQTIEISLKKSEALRQSVLKKAFEGKLVKQDSNDEPASELLIHIKEEKVKYLAEQIELKKKVPKKIKKMSKKLSIEDVLKTSNKPISAKEVWQQSKHKGNIEDFYEEIKELGEKVIEVKEGLNSLLSLKQ